MEAANEGGVILGLFFMAATIAVVVFSAVIYYESSTRSATDSSARLLRLISGWANIGNSVIHILLTIYMVSNANNESEYWVEERKLGGVEGPIGLAVLNFVAGCSALQNYGMKFPLGWNSFVAVMGTLVPFVWLRFMETGLAAWPYTIVFIWFSIFWFELTAVTCSVAHYAIDSKIKSE